MVAVVAIRGGSAPFLLCAPVLCHGPGVVFFFHNGDLRYSNCLTARSGVQKLSASEMTTRASEMNERTRMKWMDGCADERKGRLRYYCAATAWE